MSTSDSNKLIISPETTPNPASMRFVLDRPVAETGAFDCTSREQAERSPLALRLFLLPGVKGVFLGPNFVTVTAGEDGWAELRPMVMNAIQAHFESGEPVLLDEGEGAATAGEDASETEQGIIRIIEEEIRPAVAMDGGDVIFVSYEEGVVRLRLRGACHGCPSALFTLRMGIERRLREDFPDIAGVEAV